jgi:DNA (cytosine-5)-methyltransferase 1
VFVVGHLGDWKPAAEVLFESESLRGDIKKGRKEGQDAAAFTASRFGNYGEGVGTIRATGGDLGGGSETLYVPDTARCLTRGVAQKNDYETDTFVTKVYENHAQDSRVKEVDVSPTVAAKWGTGGGNVPIAIQGNLIGRDKGGPQGVGVSEGETMYTLTKADVHGVQTNMAVRRLTPVECERLQGFPDNYTNIKDKCPDGPRYKAMGNSMAVPVMRWIGERINKVNSTL